MQNMHRREDTEKTARKYLDSGCEFIIQLISKNDNGGLPTWKEREEYMKLEVAFDDVTLEQTMSIIDSSGDQIDIIEDGTLFLLREGLAPLRALREKYPDRTILADPKIMDAPEKIASSIFEAGADIVTVMGTANKKTILKVVETARKYHGQVFLDLLDVTDLENRFEYFDSLGVDYICIHASKTNPDLPFEDFRKAKKHIHHAKLAIAGGINTSNIKDITAMEPDVIIVGSGVYGAPDPAAVITELKEAFQ